MNAHIANHRDGFAAGFTSITLADASDNPSQIGLGVLRLAAGETMTMAPRCETAWLLMSGSVEGTAGDLPFSFERELAVRRVRELHTRRCRHGGRDHGARRFRADCL